MDQTKKTLNVFITAGSGLLGKALLETCPNEFKLSATYFPIKLFTKLSYILVKPKRRILHLLAKTRKNECHGITGKC